MTQTGPGVGSRWQAVGPAPARPARRPGAGPPDGPDHDPDHDPDHNPDHDRDHDRDHDAAEQTVRIERDRRREWQRIAEHARLARLRLQMAEDAGSGSVTGAGDGWDPPTGPGASGAPTGDRR